MSYSLGRPATCLSVNNRLCRKMLLLVPIIDENPRATPVAFLAAYFNPNKAGIFQGSFFWGRRVNLASLHISRRTNPMSI